MTLRCPIRILFEITLENNGRAGESIKLDEIEEVKLKGERQLTEPRVEQSAKGNSSAKHRGQNHSLLSISAT